MKHLLNALYVLTPEAYLTLDGENAVVKKRAMRSDGFHCIVCRRSPAFPIWARALR